MRFGTTIMGVALLAVLASCMNLRLPTTEEVEQIFSTPKVEANFDVVVPPHIPKINSQDLGGWRQLCDNCHRGPNYTSRTNLDWGHLETCVTSGSCIGCHGEELHRMDVRGNKRLCYECHIDRQLPVKCDTCHFAEFVSDYPKHEPEFLGTHGSNVLAYGLPCDTCHGTELWCKNCHGLSMPHPTDIIESHPDLVAGQSGVCSNCHGTHSCIRCHEESGVKLTNPELY